MYNQPACVSLFTLDCTDGYRNQMWVTLGLPQTFLKNQKKRLGVPQKKIWGYLKKISVGTQKKNLEVPKKKSGGTQKKFWGYQKKKFWEYKKNF